MMSHIRIIVHLILFVVFLVIGSRLTPSLALAAPGDTTAGKAIYTQSCVRCHGEDGRGGRMVPMLPVKPRSLAAPDDGQTRTAEQLFNIIKHGGSAQGLSAAMPAFGSQLTDDQIHATVAYITTLSQATESSLPQAAPPATSTVSAELRIARMRLSIWPEYDDPRVLILIRGEVTPASALPAKIKLPIPKGAELIGAGMVSDQNTLLNHPHEIQPGDSQDTLEFTLPVPRFFVEWYHQPFVKTARPADKQFSYALTLPYAIDQLDVDIQKPYEATEFRTVPETTQQIRQNDQGGVFYQFSYQNVQPGQTTPFTITYVKTTDRPSVQKKQPPTASRPPSPSFWANPTTLAFAMLAGVTAIYVSCVVVWRNFRPTLQDQVAPVTANAVTPHVPSPAPMPAPNFCSQCGRKLEPSYGFCPECGQSLQGR